MGDEVVRRRSNVRVLVEDVEEQYAPPRESVLSLSVAGDALIVEIGDVDERDRFEAARTVVVPLLTVARSLALLAPASMGQVSLAFDTRAPAEVPDAS